MKVTEQQYQNARIYLKGSLPRKDIARLVKIPIEKLEEIQQGKALAEINNREYVEQGNPGRPKKEIDLSTPEGRRLARKRATAARAYAKKLAA